MNINPVDIYWQMAIATLQNGGGTWERDSLRNSLPNRYVVALGSPYAVVVPALPSAKQLPLVANALRLLSDNREAWRGHYEDRALGTWEHEGQVWVDIVDSWEHGGFALHMARNRGQLAIWDSEREVSITVPK